METPSTLKRRQFIGSVGSSALFLLSGKSLANQESKPASEEFLFVEAEQFQDYGGWELDQQSMDQMGSPYLLAHGLGIPVPDAVTEVEFPSTGTYRVWVRTKDWVAPWKAPGAPGKFQLLVNEKTLPETFGTKGDQWHWQDGGLVDIADTKNALTLRDLTGFEGRCEAILFCKDPDFSPTNEVAALRIFRRALLGLPEKPTEECYFDLAVVGGGLAGTCAALASARQGLKVVLVQDRPVLGGNGSSEVRVWPEGHTQQEPYPHIGDITEEILPNITKGNAKSKWFKTMNGTGAENFDDEKKERIVRAEPKITLLLNQRAIETEMEGQRIRSIVVESTTTGQRLRLRATVFADCSGDAKIGQQAGADFEYEFSTDNPLMGSTNLFSVLDASREEEVLKCECKDKSALMSSYEEGDHEQPFPRCPWALDLSDKPFPGRLGKQATDSVKDLEKFANHWYWESGFDKDQIADIELIRDHNLRAMYGAWDALKNTDGLYKNFRLGWVAFIAGKRESRRLLGDVILDGKHFTEGKDWEDGCYPCSWHIDLHFPKKKFQKGFEGNEFISDFTHGKDYGYGGKYWAPYRTLYSRNIDNLFMAGRNISVSKTGLGPVRVMRTTGMMGEVVGKAAALCVQHKTTPRGIYQNHLTDLKDLMKQPGTKT